MKHREKLLDIMRELYNISGFRISLYSTDYREILAYPEEKLGFCNLIQSTKKGLDNCRKSDSNAFGEVTKTGKTYCYTCNCGLIEAVSPIYHYGVLSGYLMMGQVSDSREDSEKTILALSEAYADRASLEKEISGIPKVKMEMVMSYIKIMTVCAEYITLSNTVQASGKNLAELVRICINAHYFERLTLDMLCERFNCSKTTLINAFSKEYGTTVYRYLTEVRLNHAANLLKGDERKIGEISVLCGYEDCCYFSRAFSEHFGCSPGEYRKKQNGLP